MQDEENEKIASEFAGKRREANKNFKKAKREKADTQLKKVQKISKSNLYDMTTIDGTKKYVAHSEKVNRAENAKIEREISPDETDNSKMMRHFAEKYNFNMYKVIDEYKSFFSMNSRGYDVQNQEKKKVEKYIVKENKLNSFNNDFKAKYRRWISEFLTKQNKRKQNGIPFLKDEKDVSKAIDDFDHVFTTSLRELTSMALPSYGGNTRDELALEVCKTLDLKASKIGSDYNSKNKLQNIRSKEMRGYSEEKIKEEFNSTHENITNILDKCERIEDDGLRKSTTLQSIRADYMYLKKMHDAHRFYYRWFHKEQHSFEVGMLNEIKNYVMENFDVTSKEFDKKMKNSKAERRFENNISKYQLFEKNFTGTINITTIKEEDEDEKTKIAVDEINDKQIVEVKEIDLDESVESERSLK